MKIADFEKKAVVRSLPIGNDQQVVFDHAEYRLKGDDITGFWIHIKDYNPIYIPFFENGNNFQWDLFTEQLSVDSNALAEINAKKGTTIVVHKYEKFDEIRQQTFINTSFNPRWKPKDADSEVLA